MPPRGVEPEPVRLREPGKFAPAPFPPFFPFPHLPFPPPQAQAPTNHAPQKLEKTIPDQPKKGVPVHLRPRQILADFALLSRDGPFVPPKDGKEAS